MFNKRTLAVLKREIKALILNKTFIVMTILFPIIFLSGFGVTALMQSMEGVEDTRIVIVEESPFINVELKRIFDTLDVVKNGELSLKYKSLSRSQLDDFLAQNKNKLLKDSITGVVFVPDQARVKKEIEYYSTNPANFSINNQIRSVVNNALIKLRFEGTNVAAEDVRYARQRTSVGRFKIDEKEEIEEEGSGGIVLAYVFTFLLYMSVFFNGMQLMRAVTEEKNTRVVEVLLSSLSTRELMAGKILGTTISGLVQMLIWLTPAAIFAFLQSTSFSGVFSQALAEFDLNLGLGQLLYFLLNFIIGLVSYLAIFGAFGAMFDNEQEAQQGILPILMLVLIPFFIAISMVINPSSSLAEISSMLPFASIIVMPARMALVNVPAWQVVLALAVNVGLLITVIRISAKVYGVSILRTGKKITLPELFKLLRYQS